MKMWLEVTTITGNVFTSHSEKDVDLQSLDKLKELIKNIKILDSFSLETPEGVVYFNPAHIVTIKLCKQEG